MSEDKKDNRKTGSKKIAGSIAAVLTVCVAGAALAAVLNKIDHNDETVVVETSIATEAAPTFEEYIDPESESPTADRMIVFNGEQYRYREDIDTLLIIGTDTFEQETGEADTTFRNNVQADLLLLAVFDNTNQVYNIIQINRDTMTAIRKYDVFGVFQGLITEQIALSHIYGSGGDDSCRDTAFAVSNLLYGIDVDNYLEVTMSAVPILNDLAGGIDVVIEDNFEGVEESFVQGQTVHLQGDQALTYVRSRMSMPDDDTNLARMRRQRTYMTALMERLGEVLSEDPDFTLRAFAAVGDYLVTDLNPDSLSLYTERFSSYEQGDILVPEGRSVTGSRYMEFYADEDALSQLVVDIFYEKI